MEEKAEFKFEPIWISALTLLVLYVSFEMYYTFFSRPSYGLVGSLFLLLPAGFWWWVFPMTFAMLRKKPAIVLTPQFLIDNIGGFSINWHDIAEIKVAERDFKSRGNLIVNLEDPRKYFNTRLKYLGYKIRRYFTAADVSIKLDFVSGKNEDISRLINAYWFNNTRPAEFKTPHAPV